jgi:putative ABC transport system ATP-binding protein
VKHALAEIHLTIAKGEYVSIAGPSGRQIASLHPGLLDTPTEGTYTLNSQAVANLDCRARPYPQQGNRVHFQAST